MLQDQQFNELHRKAGERLEIEINVKYIFRWCPAGTFMMGSPASELERSENETQHQVTLIRGFWILETEVTQSMWESIMGENPSCFKGNDLPVEIVSWEDCQGFISLLNSLEMAPAGFVFSLPTEAQWEYACRAGTVTPYHFGIMLNGDNANCNGKIPYGTDVEGASLNKTKPVRSYHANDWGLYDMHDNVLEWCNDWYENNRKDTSNASVGQPTGPDRIVRGGSFSEDAGRCRSAVRRCFTPLGKAPNVGFRLVLVREQ